MRINWKAEKWHKAPLWCRLFGHSVAHKYPLYAKADFKTIDGIGRVHMNIQYRCDYCDRLDTVGHFHLNSAFNSIPIYLQDEVKALLSH